jgi:hypothetical protein
LLNYYLYRGPTKAQKEKKPHAFDSALLDGEKAPPGDRRPAYCYLILDKQACSRAAAATNGYVADRTTLTESAVLATVEPNGLLTTYQVEWGTTSAYGSTTEPSETAQTEGAESETVNLVGLLPCTTYHYQVVAENEANEGDPSYGGDRTFTTECETERTIELSVYGWGYGRPPEVYLPEFELEYDPVTGELSLVSHEMEVGGKWVLSVASEPTTTGFTGGKALSVSPSEDKIGAEPPIKAEVEGLKIRLKASEAYNVWFKEFNTSWHVTIER